MKQYIKRAIALISSIFIIGNFAGCSTNKTPKRECYNYHLESVLNDEKDKENDSTVQEHALSVIHQKFMNNNSILNGKYIEDERIEKLCDKLEFLHGFDNDNIKHFIRKYVASIEEEVDMKLSEEEIEYLLHIDSTNEENNNQTFCNINFTEGDIQYDLALYTANDGNCVSEAIISAETCFYDSEMIFIGACEEQIGMTDYDLVQTWSLFSDATLTTSIDVTAFPNLSEQIIISLTHEDQAIEEFITPDLAEKFITTMIMAAKNGQSFESYLKDNEKTLKVIFREEYDKFNYQFVEPLKLLEIKEKI